MPKCAIPDLPVFREAALSRSASVNDLRQGLQMKDDEGDRKVSKVSGSAAAVLGARNREKRIFETVPWQPSSRRSIVKQFQTGRGSEHSQCFGGTAQPPDRFRPGWRRPRARV